MTDTQPTKELRLKSGKSIFNFVRQFSATEKAIFGLLMLILTVSAITMAFKANNLFMTEVPAYGGTLREGVIGLPRAVNPVLSATDIDRDISSLVYSGLTKYSGGKIIPDLAKKFSVSADGLTYTFILNDGIRFQDGSSLTAEDVAYTIQKILDPALKSPRRSDWANVSVQIISPKEIHFVLKQPYSPFIANTTIGIIPKHIWSTLSDDQFVLSRYNAEPIGSGPYKISSIIRDNENIPLKYRLSSWGGYYGAEPFVSNIEFSFFSDEEKALAAIDSGAIDSLPAVSPKEASRLSADSAQAYAVVSSALPRIFGVFFNQSQNPVLADKVVRQALDMSVDRNAIIKKVLNGYGQAINGPLPTDTTSASSSISGAQALLEKNGWKKDSVTGIYQYQKKGSKNAQVLSFDIYTADTPDLKQAAEMTRDSWNKMGAQVQVKIFESSDLYQNVIRTRKYDALLFGELIGKDKDIYAFWHSSQRNSPGLNVAMYANSKVDKLLDDMRESGDDSVRNSKLKQMDGLIESDIPAVFLYSPDFVYVVPKSLRGIELKDIISQSDRFNTLNSWYITTEKVWKIFAKN